MLTVKIQFLSADAQQPKQATIGSAGWDVYAVENGIVPGGRCKRIPLGFALELPDNWQAKIKQRSSMFEKLLITNDSPIDSDWRGEVCALVTNLGEWPWHYTKGDRIGQLLFEPVPMIRWVKATELSWTERGSSGFGASGK